MDTLNLVNLITFATTALLCLFALADAYRPALSGLAGAFFGSDKPTPGKTDSPLPAEDQSAQPELAERKRQLAEHEGHPALREGQLAEREGHLALRTEYLALTLILSFGLLLRLWKFGSLPGGFNQDGAMAAVDGLALATYGTDRFGTWLPAHLEAWGYGQMSSLLSYLIAVSVRLFGFSALTARLPQLFASAMGGLFFFLYMRESFGQRAGIAASAFLAVNPWHFMQSRWALDCNLLPHFFMGGLYFLQKGLSGKRRYLYLSMVFFGLCMYCYGITVYTIPVFLLAAGGYYLKRRRLTLRELLLCAAVYLAIAWAFLLTMAVNYFGWDTIRLPFVTIQSFPYSQRSGDILFFSKAPLSQLISNLRSLLRVTLLQKDDLLWNTVSGYGTLFCCSVPFALLGGFALTRIPCRGERSIPVLALLTGVWAGLLTNNVNVNRVNIAYYGILMFAVLGVVFAFEHLTALRWCVPYVYLLMAALFFHTYFGSYADQIGACFYKGFGDALLAAEDAGTPLLYISADIQFEGYWNVSEIMTLFYDRTDARYFQGKTNENHGLEYLPYRQRFQYVSFTPELLNSIRDMNAAFVIPASDAPLFDQELYRITCFDGYCAVTGR